MKTQISRDSHNPDKRYSGVYQQQGRMLTDADWNELVTIINERITGALRDIVGSGGPADRSLWIAPNLEITPGSVYADGLTATLRGWGPFTYASQPDFPLAPGAPVSGEHLYADLWERPVLFLEDPALQDPGLHGADTCTRTQVMLQIKRCPAWIEPTDPLANPGQGNAELRLSRRGAGPVSGAVTGNYLFRLEVHDVKGPPEAPTEVTLKWSSENAAEAYANGPDAPGDFKGNDWLYEYYNDVSERHLGVHHVGVTAAFPARGGLRDGYPASVPDRSTFPYVRRWDGWCVLSRDATTGAWSFTSGGKDRSVALSTSTAQGLHGHVRIEGGMVLFLELREVELVLLLSAGPVSRTFVAGDYWLVPVREGDAEQTVLVREARPVGVLHRYVKLGTIASGVFSPEAGTINFPSLTRLMSVASGNAGAGYVGAEAHADVSGTTVQAQLSALLQLLNKVNDANRGSSLIGSAPMSASPRSLAAGSVREQLGELLNHLNAHVQAACTDHDNRYYTEAESDGRFAPRGPGSNGGYVTSVSAGTGLTGGPVTGSGSLSIDTTVVPRLGVANTFSGANTFSNTGNSFTGNGAGLTGLTASNLGSGTVPSARLAGAYTSITGVGTLSELQVTGGTRVTATGIQTPGVATSGTIQATGNISTNGSLSVGNGITVSGGGLDLTLGVARRIVPAVALKTASFQGTRDTVLNGGTVFKGDGTLVLNTAATAGSVAEVRGCFGSYTMGYHTPGSFIGFRGYLGSVSAVGHNAYIMSGSISGSSADSGGYGFRISHTGTQRQLYGVTYGMDGLLVQSVLLETSNLLFEALMAVNRGSVIEYFKNGVSLGTVTTAGMRDTTFPNYSVRLEGGSSGMNSMLYLSYLTQGNQL